MSRSSAVSVPRISSVTVPRTGPVSRPSSMRNVAAPVMCRPRGSPPALGPRPPRGKQREVQVDPAVGRHVEKILRNQVAVGDHRDRVRGQLGQAGADGVTVLGAGLERRRGEYLRCRAPRERAHRAGCRAAATAGVGAGEHRDDLMVGAQQPLQGDDRGFRGAGEDQAHTFPLLLVEPLGGTDLSHRFLAQLRRQPLEEQHPSRWSVSCWMHAPSARRPPWRSGCRRRPGPTP